MASFEQSIEARRVSIRSRRNILAIPVRGERNTFRAYVVVSLAMVCWLALMAFAWVAMSLVGQFF